MESMVLDIYVKTNYIDFEDYETPIRSVILSVVRQKVELNKGLSGVIRLKHNTFTDINENLFQEFGDPVITDFLSTTMEVTEIETYG